jgi:hypothetical protein
MAVDTRMRPANERPARGERTVKLVRSLLLPVILVGGVLIVGASPASADQYEQYCAGADIPSNLVVRYFTCHTF